MTSKFFVFAAISALASAVACGGRSPLAPTATSAAVPGSAVSVHARDTIADTFVFPLIAGSVAIENSKGDRLVGTYTGVAVSLDGAEGMSATLQIGGGSGVFAGATGTVQLIGTGAFSGEGSFQLDGRGDVSLAAGTRWSVVLNLRGTSHATCSAAERILISQDAVGSLGHAGRVNATLDHEVEGTSCSS